MTRKNILCSATVVANDGRTYKVLNGSQIDDMAPVFSCEGYNEEGQPSREWYAVIQAGKALYNGPYFSEAAKAENLALYGREDMGGLFKKYQETKSLVDLYPVSVADGEKEGTELTNDELKRRNTLNELRAKYRVQIRTATEKLNAWNNFQFFTKKDGKPFSIVSKNYDKRFLRFGGYRQAWFFYNLKEHEDGRTYCQGRDEFYCNEPQTFEELRAVVENRKKELQDIIDYNTTKLANIETESSNILALFLPVVEALKKAVCEDDVKEQLRAIYRIA